MQRTGKPKHEWSSKTWCVSFSVVAAASLIVSDGVLPQRQSTSDSPNANINVNVNSNSNSNADSNGNANANADHLFP
jgi:hypothetical protein